jgi:hypothetical protein
VCSPVVARGARMHGDLVAVGCASGAVLLLLCASFRAPVLLQTLCGGHLRRVTGNLTLPNARVLLLLCASFRAPVLLQTLCGGHLRRVTGDARVRVGL